MESQFKLNNVVIKRPSSFSLSWYNITKSERMGNSDMSMAIIGKKRKFFFKYDVISSSDKAIIMQQIQEPNTPWINLSYVEDDVVKTAKCYVGEISHVLARSGQLGGEWYWKDFNFNLIQK